MKRILVLLCTCAALGLVVGACGDDEDGSDEGGATVEQMTTGKDKAGADDAASDEAPSKPTAIEVVDIDYEPKQATVSAGTTIKWTNTGDLPHTVTKDSGPGPKFDSGTLQPGDTFEQTFDAKGTIDYLCTIHSGQTGSVTVN